jgi:hypothetical protein
MDMFAKSPLLEIYRGNLDEELRQWARDAKAFGHPFLFRLNNEMNSDWTSYGGVVNLADPYLFTAVWQRIWNIFEEGGVDNCLWIYNPNDRQAPPSNWNNSLAYYPGNEYTQMIGVTGYNNGTYYTKWAEEWREFDVIYDLIWEEYSPHFSAFPWMVTEFASSGIGGDKVKWIENMFDHIGDYPNIRIAVWFSHADYDDANGVAARTYWLDETPETVEAFRKGLKKQFGNEPTTTKTGALSYDRNFSYCCKSGYGRLCRRHLHRHLHPQLPSAAGGKDGRVVRRIPVRHAAGRLAAGHRHQLLHSGR